MTDSSWRLPVATSIVVGAATIALALASVDATDGQLSSQVRIDGNSLEVAVLGEDAGSTDPDPEVLTPPGG